jgi:hypothetical protein
VLRGTFLGKIVTKKAQLKNSIGLFGFSMVSVQLDLCLVLKLFVFIMNSLARVYHPSPRPKGRGN